MKTIKIKNREVEIIDSPSELTLDKFKKVMYLTKSEKNDVEKGIEIIEILSGEKVTKEEIDDMELEEFMLVLNMINLDNKNYPIKGEFEHNGIVYKLAGDPNNFKFKVGQMIAIEKAMKLDVYDYLHKMGAILYKDGKTSLGERESIFKANMTVDVVLPFINVIMKNYSVNV